MNKVGLEWKVTVALKGTVVVLKCSIVPVVLGYGRASAVLYEHCRNTTVREAMVRLGYGRMLQYGTITVALTG